jgi:hypothetical protein
MYLLEEQWLARTGKDEGMEEEQWARQRHRACEASLPFYSMNESQQF